MVDEEQPAEEPEEAPEEEGTPPKTPPGETEASEELPAEIQPEQISSEETPVEEEASAENPLPEEIPAEEPSEEPSAEEVPAETPLEEAPAEEVPAETPLEEAPAEEGSAQTPPPESAPETPPEEAPAEEAPAEPSPEEAPAKEAPAEPSPEEAPAEEAPAEPSPEEAPAKEAPAEPSPEEAPAEEAPAEPSPEETPPEETPAETRGQEEAPAEEVPSPEIAHVDFDLLDTEGRWLLKVLSGPNTGAEFAMHGGSSYLIGTDTQACDIVFQDLSVSRKHAKLTIDLKDNAVLEDLQSRNGTFVDGEKIEKKPVSGNVLVSMGTTTFMLIDREAERTTIVAGIGLEKKRRACTHTRRKRGRQRRSSRSWPNSRGCICAVAVRSRQGQRRRAHASEVVTCHQLSCDPGNRHRPDHGNWDRRRSALSYRRGHNAKRDQSRGRNFKSAERVSSYSIQLQPNQQSIITCWPCAYLYG